jgi:hypothetical protein
MPRVFSLWVLRLQATNPKHWSNIEPIWSRSSLFDPYLPNVPHPYYSDLQRLLVGDSAVLGHCLPCLDTTLVEFVIRGFSGEHASFVTGSWSLGCWLTMWRFLLLRSSIGRWFSLFSIKGRGLPEMGWSLNGSRVGETSDFTTMGFFFRLRTPHLGNETSSIDG